MNVILLQETVLEKIAENKTREVPAGGSGGMFHVVIVGRRSAGSPASS